jgi:hypothetical protein
LGATLSRLFVALRTAEVASANGFETEASAKLIGDAKPPGNGVRLKLDGLLKGSLRQMSAVTLAKPRCPRSCLSYGCPDGIAAVHLHDIIDQKLKVVASAIVVGENVAIAKLEPNPNLPYSVNRHEHVTRTAAFLIPLMRSIREPNVRMTDAPLNRSSTCDYVARMVARFPAGLFSTGPIQSLISRLGSPMPGRFRFWRRIMPRTSAEQITRTLRGRGPLGCSWWWR